MPTPMPMPTLVHVSAPCPWQGPIGGWIGALYSTWSKTAFFGLLGAIAVADAVLIYLVMPHAQIALEARADKGRGAEEQKTETDKLI